MDPTQTKSLERVIERVGIELLSFNPHPINLLELRRGSGIGDSYNPARWRRIFEHLENSSNTLRAYASQEESDLTLAARMYDYNLRNLGDSISMHILDVFQIKENRKAESKDAGKFTWTDILNSSSPELTEDFFLSFPLFRIFGLSMSYLAASGNDRKFLVNIPYQDVRILLEHHKQSLACHNDRQRVLMNFPGYDRVEYAPLQIAVEKYADKKIELDMPPDGHIMNPEFVALWEMIKNAIDFEQPPRLSAREETECKIITVRDYGTGILDEKGFALPIERLPEIFGNFSTKNGGLGLYLSKRLIELREGYIEVETKTGENPSIKYNTKTSKSSLGEQPETGTRFTIYLPKNKERRLGDLVKSG